MDDDGDGFAADQDCDDKDKAIYPGADDAWYDGIDSDCAQDDDYDQDLDGFVANEYVGLATQESRTPEPSKAETAMTPWRR